MPISDTTVPVDRSENRRTPSHTEGSKQTFWTFFTVQRRDARLYRIMAAIRTPAAARCCGERPRLVRTQVVPLAGTLLALEVSSYGTQG